MIKKIVEILFSIIPEFDYPVKIRNFMHFTEPIKMILSSHLQFIYICKNLLRRLYSGNNFIHLLTIQTDLENI